MEKRAAAFLDMVKEEAEQTAADNENFVGVVTEQLADVTAYLDDLGRELPSRFPKASLKKLEGPVENRANGTVRYRYGFRPTPQTEVYFVLIVRRARPDLVELDMPGGAIKVETADVIGTIEGSVRDNLLKYKR